MECLTEQEGYQKGTGVLSIIPIQTIFKQVMEQIPQRDKSFTDHFIVNFHSFSESMKFKQATDNGGVELLIINDFIIFEKI